MNRAAREQFGRELQESRDYHQTEVAFIRANPIHTPEVGAHKAKQFIAHLTELTEWIEKNWDRPGGESDPSPSQDDDAPAHYEVEVFFTPEQRAEVAALHARIERVELVSKAQSYDQLLQTLEQCGLCPDAMLGDDGKLVEIIAIENRRLANEWFKNAHSWEDNEDD
jgi:hypothetical protein